MPDGAEEIYLMKKEKQPTGKKKGMAIATKLANGRKRTMTIVSSGYTKSQGAPKKK